MTNEELKKSILDLYPSAVFDETGEWLTVHVEPDHWHVLARQVHLCVDLDLDYLFCLTCIDWKTHLTMVYHLTSTRYRHTLVFKSKLDRTHPVIHTVCHLWRTAELHEREVFDLFGVKFTNHPDLRRLLLTDDWKGFPLRKDYEDPVNLIKL